MIYLMESIKYPYIKRIPIPQYPKRGSKPYMTIHEVDSLLEGHIIVEEKLDGKLTCIPTTASITPVFEYMEWVHSIHYTNLPYSVVHFHIGLDILDSEGTILSYTDKSAIFSELHVPLTPLLLDIDNVAITIDHLISLMDMSSSFGSDYIEGIVVKNYEKKLFGKIVNPKFDREIDEKDHWLRSPRRRNWINSAGKENMNDG